MTAVWPCILPFRSCYYLMFLLLFYEADYGTSDWRDAGVRGALICPRPPG
jgi:hypothetical protein